MAPMPGEQVKRIRELAGYTQQELADRIGVDRVTLAKWEGGQHPVSETAARLLRVLAVLHGMDVK